MEKIFKSKKIILVILTILGIVLTFYCIQVTDEKFSSFLLGISSEILGGVITIILFDIIIGEKEKRSEKKENLFKDLIHKESNIREWAFIKLIDEQLLHKDDILNIEFTSFIIKQKTFDTISFSFCSFKGTNLEASKFLHCKFYKCHFNGTILDECTFESCVFEKCDFEGTFIGGTFFLKNTSISFSTINSLIFDNETRFDSITLYENIYDVTTKNKLIEKRILSI